ncbi:hypothetical protein NDU88_002471 [Pleurodeles waltl]|uniref:Secreted protein n=1 Tax=Pleurodeles waltl TaxID=8319 RepID=A0AAV7L1C6_PLEWA|nr:hypothetical protein NDU88_002471 [Pleurodeles waltl]
MYYLVVSVGLDCVVLRLFPQTAPQDGRRAMYYQASNAFLFPVGLDCGCPSFISSIFKRDFHVKLRVAAALSVWTWNRRASDLKHPLR